MEKRITFVNGWNESPRDEWTIVSSGVSGSFYCVLYGNGYKRKRVFYQAEGRPVFIEEWEVETERRSLLKRFKEWANG